jgi:peroxidase
VSEIHSVGTGGDEMSSALILLVTFMMISSAGVDATLRVDYYNKCCPNVEKIVYREMREAYQKDRTVAPGVLRVHFHDCFVRVSTNHACDSKPLILTSSSVLT